MNTFALPIEALSVVLWGDDKRRVQFRAVHDMTPTGVECQFGLTEYLYCQKHLTCHEQKNEAYVPISNWSKLVGFTELLHIFLKPIMEQMLVEKSKGFGEKNESVAEPEPARGSAITDGYGCAPTGTPEQR